MGMSNFTTPPSNNQPPNGPQNPGGPASPGGPTGPGGGQGGPMAPVNPVAGEIDSVTEMLINYNERFASADPARFRDEVVALTSAILISRSKPNPLLVGPAGVGKTKIAEEIARRIANDPESLPKQLRGSTIYELPLANLVAGAGIVGELEERLTKLVAFASDPDNDAIIFIDEIHLITQTRNDTYSKAAQILKPALARGDMRVIGATTSTEARGFNDDPALKRRFSRVLVDELSSEQTRVVLGTARSSLQAHYKHQVVVSDATLDQVDPLAQSYGSADSHRPDGALTLLDRSMAQVLVHHNRAITKAVKLGDTVTADVLRQAYPLTLSVRQVEQTARRLASGNSHSAELDLESLTQALGQLVGQDEAIGQVLDDIRQREAGLLPADRPRSWILAGPSGVGKTETARIVAREVTREDPIILNMAEYAHRSDINRLLGAPPGYVGSDSHAEKPLDGLLTNPYRVVVLDEFEKADIVVQRVFLSALDNGYVTTSDNQVIDMSKTIIVATTNAGRDLGSRASTSLSPVREVPTAQTIAKSLEQHFEPEVLGRFSRTIAYAPLTDEHFALLLQREYAQVVSDAEARNPRHAGLVPAQLEDDEAAELARTQHLPSQGARPVHQLVRDLVAKRLFAELDT